MKMAQELKYSTLYNSIRVFIDWLKSDTNINTLSLPEKC